MQATTVSLTEALEQGLISTYTPATPEQAENAKAVLQGLAQMDIAKVTQSEDGESLDLFIISLLGGEAYDVTITRRRGF